MTIDDKAIQKLAKLSSLNIEDSKKEHLKEELAQIVSFVDNLNEVDVSGIDATFTTIDASQPLREDIVTNDDTFSKHVISHAPKVMDNYFIVPPIIE